MNSEGTISKVLGTGCGASAARVPAGYKRTEVGIIPSEWQATSIGDLFESTAGGDFDPTRSGDGQNDSYPYPIYANGLSQEGLYGFCNYAENRPGSITVTARGTLGKAFYRDTPFVAIGRLLVLEPNVRMDARYFSNYINHGVHFAVESTGVPQLTAPQVARYLLPVPPESEQRAIAEALSAVDGLLRALEGLIAKKRAIKQAAMQQLLTGRTRLPGFTGEWETKKISEVATHCNVKNSLAEVLPVLTCSKHLGLVDSLSYFKNQVFSKDLSGYKIIRRGQIGYPANHIEEGSIGLQDIYDVALVSPIYVVCAPKDGINSYFLQRLLKLDRYQQKFAIATTSSVDRRGSLRWPAFSELVVKLPYIDEQEAIAAILSDMDAEIAALERRRDKTNAINQGMMQQLLTGRVRFAGVSGNE